MVFPSLEHMSVGDLESKILSANGECAKFNYQHSPLALIRFFAIELNRKFKLVFESHIYIKDTSLDFF